MSIEACREGEVQRIARISLPVVDLGCAVAFYADALGFEVLRREGRSGQAREAATLRLGREEIELVRFDPPGAPYPTPRTASDPWFQHFAIVVSDMAAAYARLLAHGGSTAISVGGPQHLPPSTGSVTAYKFRDPEGHPLELSFFPPGTGAERWQARDRLFLGIDHSGLVVSDLAASVAFYCEKLAFAASPILVNSGPSQARLDGLNDPVVDIVALSLSAGPHIELLAYRGATRRPAARDVSDVAATQLVMRTANISRAGDNDDARRREPTLLRDPDGHLLRLE